MNRSAGILLSVSSLPSNYGIGCFSKEAYEFVDKLKKAGQSFWQILPLGPTGYGDSPYQSFSTFAGNPYFIDLECLISQGLLTKAECDAISFGKEKTRVDYHRLYKGRFKLLRKAYERSRIYKNDDFHAFLNANSGWIYDYSLFMAVKDFFLGKPWNEWPEDIRKRYTYALDYYRRELYYDIEFQQYIQFEFYRQWNKLKEYANSKGIEIIGDIPIYVAYDSADAWAHPELFQFDKDNLPIAVAGCPPDGFSATGQLWGNPLYRWDYHGATGYKWWIDRMTHCFSMYDVVRIDHFRGFDEYYSIPYKEVTALNGHWEKGPGISLFKALENALGENRVIAEDLGYVNDSVRRLVKESGFPGMKVLEFAFDSRDTGAATDYLPHNYIENTVVYTGTHDNETLSGWWNIINDTERMMVRDYLCDYYTPDNKMYEPLVALAMGSVSRLCVIPMQDYMGLDNTARMNQPSTVGENWKWRLKKNDFSDKIIKKIYEISLRYGRV